MVPVEAKSAISAARAAVWAWSRTSGRLHISADPGSATAELDGDWSIADFLKQVDGLSRAAVERLTDDGTPGFPIDETVELCNGATARFIGAFVDSGAAHGLIYTDQVVELRNAMEMTDLEPVYQPICRADTGALAGFEALARWRNDNGELMGPDDLAAQGRAADWTQIAPVMVSAAARALSLFRRAAGDVFMQVNLSAAEIARAALVRDTELAIESSGLPDGVLRIELTEQAAMRDSDRALGALGAFRAAGAGLVLDDFGAGHSTLAWLSEVPADGLKLDQRLTSMMARPRGVVIIKSVIELAHQLGMTVTAEGVESAEQFNALRSAGCDFVQGFHIGAPKCLEELLDELGAMTA